MTSIAAEVRFPLSVVPFEAILWERIENGIPERPLFLS